MFQVPGSRFQVAGPSTHGTSACARRRTCLRHVPTERFGCLRTTTGRPTLLRPDQSKGCRWALACPYPSSLEQEHGLTQVACSLARDRLHGTCASSIANPALRGLASLRETIASFDRQSRLRRDLAPTGNGQPPRAPLPEGAGWSVTKERGSRGWFSARG